VYATLETAGEQFEIILVNDGSGDRSLDEIRRLVAADPRIKGISFSRNFGQQAALTAGMDAAAGDAVILMDADLQDEPEALPCFIRKWREGFDVVYAVRSKRKESLFKRAAFKLFYRVQAYLANIHTPLDSGVFCLMDRRVVDAMKNCGERNRYLTGLRAWVGYRQTGVTVERGARYDGKSRVGWGGLFKLAFDAVFSFSVVPLRIATTLALILGLASMYMLAFIIYHKLITHRAIPGWASGFGATLLLGSIQLFALGLIGEYLGRIYDEVKRRPLYIITDTITNTGSDSGGVK